MKTCFAFGLLGALLLGATSALAQGSAAIIKQRAKELRDQNNVEQGVPSPAPPVSSAASGAAPAGANPAQPLAPHQQHLLRLWNTLLALKPEAHPAPPMKQRLAKDLLGAADGPNKPSERTANKLADGLFSALSENLLSEATRRRLLGDINAVLNPENIAQPQLRDITGDIQAIFQANNLERKQAAAIASDAKALAVEIQNAALK